MLDSQRLLSARESHPIAPRYIQANMSEPDISRPDLESLVAEHTWYHTLELGHGVVTPGWFDTRPAVCAVRFPASLAGVRCLDVATFDGFWAFEMERRGAAEVVAIDLVDAT